MTEATALRRWGASSTAIETVVATIEDQLSGDEQFEKFERRALAIGNEITRRLLERRLNACAESFGEEVRVRRHIYRRHQPATVTYHSLCGPLHVKRGTYRRRDVRNGPTVVPLDLSEGLMEDSTPALAFSLAQGYARMPTRDYEAELGAAHRQLPSRSTLERMGKRLGGLAKRELPRIEPVVRQREPVPKGACSISVGLDRTSTPMIEERPADQPATTKRKRRTKPYVRRPPHPFDVAYRMAYVGTVAIHDQAGDTLRTVRFAATAEEGPDELVGRIVAEVTHLRADLPDVPLVVVQDGAPELWHVLGEAFALHDLRIDHMLIDRFHLNERLAQIAEILAPPGDERRRLLGEWQQALDRSDGAIDRIARFLDRELEPSLQSLGGFSPPRTARRTRYNRRLGGERLRQLIGHVNYVSGNARLMRYASVRQRGLPIASGVTEGACKSVVQARFKRSGARWYQDGLSACLTLRALLLSDRLAAAWPALRRRYLARVTPLG